MVAWIGRNHQFIWKIFGLAMYPLSMKKILLLSFDFRNMTFNIMLSAILFCQSCQTVGDKAELARFSLDDFYTVNEQLTESVEAAFQKLDAKSRIAQMIVVSAGTNGKPTKKVDELISKNIVGGVLMLGGEKQQIIKLGHRFYSLSRIHGNLPLLYSSDAEPSLINRKIKGTQIVPNTIDLVTKVKCDSVAAIISKELLSMGIMHNYAPVVDMSANNEAITNRTFGSDPAQVVSLASAFIKTSQNLGVVATAKHFPGHGLVGGDTHNQLVTIDGEMKEIVNYIPLIQQGVLSIMVGHIAIINNEKYQTDGLPSSCSRVIVTDLLKNEMGFKGIVITDAMNMGAVQKIENASLKAVEAGCDMILMEPDEQKLLDSVYKKYMENQAFRDQVDQSVRKVLRLKACLNLL